MRISGKVFSMVVPLVVAAVFTATLSVLHRPLLAEIVAAATLVSAVYFLFLFACLYFNIGARKSTGVEFSDIPGLTKNPNWFGKVASLDFSGAIELASGADHPGAWVLGFLLSIVVSIILPIALAITIFLLSGGVELIVFLAAVVSYFTFFQLLRYQLTSRRTTKFKVLPSLGYSLLFTAATIGLLPLGLGAFMLVTGRP